jgi:hypothetical protein
LGIERCPAGEQFVEENAQAVDVRAGIDVEPAHLGLFGADVGWGANERLELRELGFVRQALVTGFGDAEIDHLGNRHAVMKGDEDIRWLDVAVDDAFLMRMLDRLADLNEELQTFAGRQTVLIAIVRDPDPAHQFHHEIRPPFLRATRVQHPRDVRMIHQRQCLSFRFEPGDD